MSTYKHKIISGISITFITLLTTLLPSIVTIAVFFSSTLIIATYSVTQHYDIDFKYWFNFIAQLSGLVIIAASFILMLIIGFNWLGF
ncbi:MAG: hypothetical protein JKY19_16415 [Alcanivoracaceae bacterium]|nr:hypothetical protein [Alcanivoracaceae bacterium]